MSKQYYNIDEINKQIKKLGYRMARIHKMSELEPKDLKNTICSGVCEKRYFPQETTISIDDILEEVIGRKIAKYRWYSNDEIVVEFEDEIDESDGHEDDI